MKLKLRLLSLVCLRLLPGLLVALCSSLSWSQTGVSDDRVSLPEGPGSLEGVGEQVSVNTNMGALSYSVPIPLPPGFAGATPSLGLSYSSGSGSGPVGIGWSLPMPAIERMTYRGLPTYDRDDDFAASGQQLVRVVEGADPVYRARFEGGFVRYIWHGAGTGAEGYWEAQLPDGTRAFYGADRHGVLVGEARVSGAPGTFRYHLVEQVDVFGHVLRYDYVRDGVYALLSEIGWVFDAQGEPTYRAALRWEARQDGSGREELSDAKAGFDVRLTQRLSQVEVFSRGVRIHRVALGYEPYAAAGGFTRLIEARSYGANDGLYPAYFSFTYSRALGGVCSGEDCAQPFTRPMGSVGASLAAGDATLIDINGDSLPDLLLTRPDQPHRFFLNIPDVEGNSRFASIPVESAVGTSALRLGTRFVHVLDVNGDGFTDLLNAQTGTWLRNTGQGDWDALVPLVTVGELPMEDFELGEGSALTRMRFVDLDNDKRIDLLRATSGVTTAFRNLGEQGFAQLAGVDPLERSFDQDVLDLTDMNGDGLLDLVQVLVGSLAYRLNHGWGRWGAWRSVPDLPLITDANRRQVQLEDLNGDGLADLVWVVGREVHLALNRNGAVFYPAQVYDASNVNVGAAELPLRTDGTTVLVADMNGNGTNDVVWVELDGDTTYLELFPVRPNLLSRVENQLGHVMEAKYSTSVQHMARDAQAGRAWRYRLPFPMNVVEEVDDYDLLTGVHDVDRYIYRDGFYDGVEKQYRGYAETETLLIGDESQEDGVSVMRYDVGATDVYRNGLQVFESMSSGGRVLSETTTAYGDCPVAEVPSSGLDLPVRWLCEVAEETVLKEGTPEGEWVRVRSELEHDGYGNVVREARQGVVSVGGGSCESCGGRGPEEFGAPCGPQCLGDEMFVERDYIAPGVNTAGRWIIHMPWRERTYGRAGSPLVKEQRSYYDGAPFVGMPEGRLALGLVTRTTHNVEPGSGRVIELLRMRHDAHGMVVEALDPLATLDGPDHRRRYAYDAEHLRVTRIEVPLVDPEGQPYALRQEVQYEPRFDRPSEATSWLRVVDGEVQSARRSSFFQYDEFGRISARVLPGGDTAQSPTETYSYELGSPVSRLVVRQRSEVGGPLDLERIVCLDGRGRTIQTRTRIEEGRYQVNGFIVYNRRSSPLQVFQPYLGESAECGMEIPAGTRWVERRYDASERLLEEHAPDATLYGEASVRRMEYGPLRRVDQDGEDTDMASPFAQTPVVYVSDGLGREVGIERWLTTAQVERIALHYDSLGRVAGFTDPGGNRQEQVHDLLDRVLEVQGTHTEGPAAMEWDDAGNLVRSVDARGAELRWRHDGLNRAVARRGVLASEDSNVQWFYDRAPGCDAARECTNAEGMLAATRYPLGDGSVGEDTVGYDVRGRLRVRARALGEQRFGFSYGWDNANRLVETVYPNGVRVERRWDAASRLVAIPGVIERISYEARGLADEVRYSDGSRTSQGWDALMRLDRLATAGDGEAVLQGFGYAWDRVGNLRAITDEAAARRDAAADAGFGYDAWYRVLEARLEGGAETLSYRYDALDNVLEVSSDLGAASAAHQGVYSYTGAGPNAVTQAGELTLDYDAAGYTTRRGELMLTWDALGRLTAAQRGGAEQARFVYGAEQERVIKREGASTVYHLEPDFELRDGVSTLYVRVGRGRVARLEDTTLAANVLPDVAPEGGDGELRANDAWVLLSAGSGDEGEAARVLRGAAARLFVEAGPTRTLLHRDHLGSLTLATAEGATVGQQAFSPSGQVRAGGFGWVDHYGFTGQERDASTGLVRFLYRYLDVELGRWTSVDPAFNVASAELMNKLGESTTGYAYVANRFTIGTDPTGLCLACNRADGRSFESFVFNELNKAGVPAAKIQTQVAAHPLNPNQTVDPTVSFRPDFVVDVSTLTVPERQALESFSGQAPGALVGVDAQILEAKNSDTAPYTKGQKRGYPKTAKYGFYEKNGAGKKYKTVRITKLTGNAAGMSAHSKNKTLHKIISRSQVK